MSPKPVMGCFAGRGQLLSRLETGTENSPWQVWPYLVTYPGQSPFRHARHVVVPDKVGPDYIPQSNSSLDFVVEPLSAFAIIHRDKEPEGINGFLDECWRHAISTISSVEQNRITSEHTQP
jgi:hypothetical protein